MYAVKIRIGLFALNAFLALTAFFGAISVVPTLPADWIRGSVFPDYTIPALGLGSVAVVAAAAAVALLLRPKVGAVASTAAGLMIIGFELVEIATVGFSLVTHGPGMPQSWLQVVYLVIGAVLGLLGLRLWHQDWTPSAKFHPAA
jgi:hypothetical protein